MTSYTKRKSSEGLHYLDQSMQRMFLTAKWHTRRSGDWLLQEPTSHPSLTEMTICKFFTRMCTRSMLEYLACNLIRTYGSEHRLFVVERNASKTQASTICEMNINSRKSYMYSTALYRTCHSSSSSCSPLNKGEKLTSTSCANEPRTRLIAHVHRGRLEKLLRTRWHIDSWWLLLLREQNKWKQHVLYLPVTTEQYAWARVTVYCDSVNNIYKCSMHSIKTKKDTRTDRQNSF